MPVLDITLIGPLRVLLLIIMLFVIHQMITKQPLSTYSLNYVLKRLFFYGSLVFVVVFVLVQVNMYDTFTVLSLFFVMLVLQYFNFGKLATLRSNFKQKRYSFLLSFFRFLEHNPKQSLQTRWNSLKIVKINYVFVSAFVTALAVFISRYAFLKNDLYTLSNLWVKNLSIVKKINLNKWFTSGLELKGELVFVNFYSKITGISEEIAMHSFGLIENFILGIVIYWVVSKMAKSIYVAPIVSVLFFAFYYDFMPININILLEHNPLYFALCFLLPAMLFTLKPTMLVVSKNRYTLIVFLLYVVVCFVNLFVAVFIVPVFLVIAVLCVNKINKKYVFKSILAFVAALGFMLSVYGTASYFVNKSFADFLYRSLLLVDVYTYFPHLAITLNNLLFAYKAIAIITFLVLLPKLFFNKEKWLPALIFVMFFIVITFLVNLNFKWLDVDLYYQSLSVFIVVVIGILVGVLTAYIKDTFLLDVRKYKPIIVLFLFVIIALTAYKFNPVYTNYVVANKQELKTSVLNVYHNLSTNNLPYSYGVVNSSYGHFLSESEHTFINYKDFLANYTHRDSIYHLNKNNKPFLKANPEYVLPNSVFVFVSKTTEKENEGHLVTNTAIVQKIETVLHTLTSKNRTVKVYYKTPNLTVYKIVNIPNSTNLNNLIIKL
ncbi:hypothetical protein [Cellulophaga omnivescoria]|uniref:hypothetical protein n=1 Tax=Cellulophaga omnivescoria TaxID=1888890 RepID=UPI0009865F1F|nr:hypothetical protein [Cellulophaga omnivescoria]